MKRLRLAAQPICGLFLLALLPGVAFGGLDQLLNESIDASACQPVSPGDAERGMLTPAGWTFAPGETGSLMLECPISTPHRYLSNPEQKISRFVLWYRDPDGTALVSNVRADLCYRLPTAATSGCYATIDSSDSAATTFTSRQHRLGLVFPMHDAQYFVKVELMHASRSSNDELAFKGLSFSEQP